RMLSLAETTAVRQTRHLYPVSLRSLPIQSAIRSLRRQGTRAGGRMRHGGYVRVAWGRKGMRLGCANEKTQIAPKATLIPKSFGRRKSVMRLIIGHAGASPVLFGNRLPTGGPFWVGRGAGGGEPPECEEGEGDPGVGRRPVIGRLVPGGRAAPFG